MPVISRNAPAFAVNGLHPAGQGNDADYGTEFRGRPPTSLVYNLTAVPPVHRARVVVAWYNDDTIWDAGAINARAYNEPRDYTVDANPTHNAPSPPIGGWVTLVRVSANRFNSRLHTIDMTGFNWIRMSVTAVNGSPDNFDAAFNLDVHDATDTAADAWWFFGDSITEDDMTHRGPGATFAQLINAKIPTQFPAQQDGGIGGWDSAAPLKIDPVTKQQYFAQFLAVFPGRYVSLALGTNDANGMVAPKLYEANMAQMVKAVLDAGKVPILPLIPWGCTPGIASDGPKINAAVKDLWAAYPQIVHGPDFWAYFQANQKLIAQDCIHPTLPAGADAYRQLYSRTMLREVYGVSESAP